MAVVPGSAQSDRAADGVSCDHWLARSAELVGIAELVEWHDLYSALGDSGSLVRLAMKRGVDGGLALCLSFQVLQLFYELRIQYR